MAVSVLMGLSASNKWGELSGMKDLKAILINRAARVLRARAAVLGPLLGGLAAALLALPAWAAIPIVQWTDASGAEVFWVENRALPMLDLQIDFDAGSRRDPASQAGLAGALAGMLDSGVLAHGKRGALDENALNEAWLDLGAQFSATASPDRLSLGLRSLSDPEVLPQVLQLLAQQLAAPAWSDTVWQRQRQRLVGALKEAETRPETQAERAFSTAVYGDHPYGQVTTEASLGAIAVSDLAAFYRRHALACAARISLVGDLDRAAAQALVAQLMAALGAQPCVPLPLLPEVAPLQAASEIRLPFPAAQAQVLLGQPGYRRDDPDFFPLLLGNYTLGGGGFVSRLTEQVREKRGLSYSVYSYFSPGKHAGAFTVGLSTRPDQAEQALELAHQVVRDFVADGPTDDELQAAKDFMINGFALRIDSNRKLLGNVANIAWNRLPLDYLQTWTARVQQVDRESVRRAMARVLQPERMVRVLVGAP